MTSFDVNALFSNVPVKGAMKAIELALSGISSDELPVPKSDLLKLVELCLDFQAFIYGGEEFAQANGLAMGSPLSPVAACLYMELLEKEHFENVMGADATWFRYIDVLILAPEEMNLNEKLEQLSEVDSTNQFTLETETNGTLPFLDVLMMNHEDSVKYRVPTYTERRQTETITFTISRCIVKESNQE